MGRHLPVLLAAFCLSTAYASTNELKTQLETRKRLDMTALIQGESNLYGPGTRDYQATGRIQLAPSYRLNERFKTTLAATILQDLSSPERKTSLGNMKLSVSHAPVVLSQDSTLLASAGARLPTNLEDHRDKTYNGSVVLEPTLLTQFAPAGFTFTAISGLYLTKNFHTFDRTSTGDANLDYQGIAYLGVEKYLTRHISITLDGDYIYAATYQHDPRTLFDFGQSVTYEEKTWSVTLGHTNGGDALQANGTDYNIRVFDQNTSSVYANMRVSY